MITVFTPAYNRAHLLPRLYESLCRQTYKYFEWVVVDDGSVDETAELFSSNVNVNDNENFNSSIFPSFNSFKVRYFYQQNGGKHRAINRGVKEARGELFFIADSDDMLPPDALEIVAKVYEDIKDNPTFAGVCGLDGTFDGKVIGSGLPADVIDDTSIVVRSKMGVTGDMKEVFRTSVLKEFPFPEIEGERFCSEALLWNRIATKYKLRYFNQVIYLAEYQSDGITAGIVKARMNSPVASMMTYLEMTQFKEVPVKEKIKAAINYWRFRLCAHNLNGSRERHTEITESTEIYNRTQISQISQINGNYPKLPWYWNWTMPIGWAMHVKDVNNKKTRS